jgi:putative methyltransferase (TIGR04325 family)
MRRWIAALARKISPPTGVLEGYDDPELVDFIFRKTRAFRPKGSWPDLQDAATVLDFGGGCGIHYKQAKSSSVKWAVVETTAMVERASEISTDKLRFFADVAEAADWLGSVELMHSNAALQYTPDPHQALNQLCSLKAQRMIWRRMELAAETEERKTQSTLLSLNGPRYYPRLNDKTVTYPLVRLPESRFLSAHKDYELRERGPNWFKFNIRDTGFAKR